MRSDNLKKHVKIHEKADIDSQPLLITEQKRRRSTDNLLTTDIGDFSVNQKTLVVNQRIQRFKPYLMKL